MKTLIAICAASALLAGCNSLTGSSTAGLDINKFLTDPSCAHHDEITGVTGAAGVPASLQFKASRDCPGTTGTPIPAVTPAT